MCTIDCIRGPSYPVEGRSSYQRWRLAVLSSEITASGVLSYPRDVVPRLQLKPSACRLRIAHVLVEGDGRRSMLEENVGHPDLELPQLGHLPHNLAGDEMAPS